jgi:subtilisin family serine protease
MEQEYAILRKKRPPVGTYGSEIPGADSLSLERDSMSLQARIAAQDSSDVLAIAPRMGILNLSPLATSIDGVWDRPWAFDHVKAYDAEAGDGLRVAILDSGIDLEHPVFRHTKPICKDFTGNGIADAHGHGTHCASTLFGGQTSEGHPRLGIVPRATPMIAKVLDAQGRGDCINLVDAIIWAGQNGASVISISIGLDFPGFAHELQENGMPASAATSAAISAYLANLQLFDSLADHLLRAEAIGRCSIIVAAAGNESSRKGTRPYIISASPLAAGTHVITVGAATLAEDGIIEVASYSNSGADIFGPGTDVSGAIPGGSLALMSGTSMATPFVAGAAALMIDKLRKSNVFRSDQIFAAIRANTSPVRDANDADGNAGLVRVP